MNAPGFLRSVWHRILLAIIHPRVLRFLSSWTFPNATGMKQEALNLLTAKRIGVIRMDGMGDLIVTTAFLRELRRSVPSAQIILVIRDEWVPLMQNCPHVDKVVGIASDWSHSYRSHKNLWRYWKAARRELLPRQLDVVLLPQSSYSFFEARWLAWLSGASFRAGRKEANSDDTDPAWGYLTHIHLSRPGQHDVEACLQWLEAMGGSVRQRHLEITPGDSTRLQAMQWLSQVPVGRVPVALGIGASQSEKVWPLNRFEEIAVRLIESGAFLLVVGGSDFKEGGLRLQERLDGAVLDLTGKLPLDVTAAVLEACRLYIGNDSGPMHLAAAMGIPVVEIAGWPADVSADVGGTPLRIGPWCEHRRIVQPSVTVPGPILQVDRISVEDVWDAICSLAKQVQVVGLHTGKANHRSLD